MALNNEDFLKINYKAKVDWYKHRIASLSQGFVNPSVSVSEIDPEKYRANLDDLKKKIGKLNKRIDDSCAGLKIPIDKIKDQSISKAVLSVDPNSGGEYVSYELYKRLLEQMNHGVNSLKIDDVILSSSSDSDSNSQLIQDRIYSGYSEYDGGSKNTGPYADIIASWNTKDYNIRNIISFSDEYLSTYPSPQYEPWAFKGDVELENSQVDGFRGLWNGYSEAGKRDIEQFDGAFKNLKALRPDPSIAGVTDRYLDYTNKFLNDLDRLFGSTWTADLICCFMKYIVKLDPKTIKAFLTMLQFLKSGLNFDFGEIQSFFKDMFNNFMRNLIMNQLIGLVDQMFQRIMSPVRKWIQNLGDGGTKLFECTPVKELLIQYLDSAALYAENYIKEMIIEWYKNIELKKIHQDMKISQASDNKWLNKAIELLNTVVRAMELSANCGLNDTPQSDPANQIMDQMNHPSNYRYPVETSPNIYNSFITPEQQAAVEQAISDGNPAAVPSIINAPATQQAITVATNLANCRKNIMTVDMPEPIKWAL